MINAGSLTDRVVLLEQTVRVGQYGERVQEWREWARCWARVTFRKGQRALEGGDVWLPRTVVVKLRWRAGVSERMRVVHDGRTYGIDSLNAQRSEGEIQLVCTRIDDTQDGTT